MEFIKKNKKYLYAALFLIIGLFGVFLRLQAYLVNSSLWLDEVSLALNLENNIFLPPLINKQSAPFLFMILAKICTFFSHSNFSYRFIPFIASLASIPVFYFFLKHWIKSKLGQILAFFIFCINFRLIYFSREFKPYALDVLVFMLAIMCFFRLDFAKIKTKTSALYGFCYALLPMLSFSSLFVLPVAYLFSMFKIKENFKSIVAFIAPSLVLIPVYYFLFFANYSNNEYLLRFWDKGFVTFKTVLPVFIGVMDYFMQPYMANIFLIVSVVMGLILCLKQNRKYTLFVLGTIITLVLASMLHKYPIQERLVLFLLPVMLVFAFKIFDINMFKTRAKNLSLALLLCFFSFFLFIKTDIKVSLDEKFYHVEAIEGLLDVLKAEHKDGEYIFPLPWSDFAFLHYNQFYHFPEKDFIIFEGNHAKDYTKPFWGVPKGRYWLIFTQQRDNYSRWADLQNWLNRDFKIIKVYQDHTSRMYYAEKIR